MQCRNVYRWQGIRYSAGVDDPIDDMIRRGLISEEERTNYVALRYDAEFGMSDGHGHYINVPLHAPGEFLFIIKKKAA